MVEIQWNKGMLSVAECADDEYEDVYKICKRNLCFESNEMDRPVYDISSGDLWTNTVQLWTGAGNRIVFYTGLVHRLKKLLDMADIEYTITKTWSDDELIKLSVELPEPNYREVQKDVPERMHRNIRACREGAPRIGKTYEMYGCIARIGVRTLVIVERSEWMNQTEAKFKALVGPDNEHMIGVYGNQRYNPSEITICIRRALNDHLLAGKDVALALTATAGLIVWDEGDLTAASTMSYNIMERCVNAPYSLGFSATFLSRKSVNNEMLIEALTGPVVKITDAVEAKERGYHSSGTALYIKMPRICCHHSTDYSVQRELYLTDNVFLNEIIAYLVALSTFKKKQSTLVLTHVVEQAKKIQEYAPNLELVYGQSSNRHRKEVLQKFKEKALLGVVTTLYDRAVDIPCLETCILAGGGKSEAKFVQSIYRPKTIDEKPKHAFLVDFIHQVSLGAEGEDMLPLEKHSYERLKIIKADGSWDVKEIELHEIEGFYKYFRRKYPNGVQHPVLHRPYDDIWSGRNG